MGQVVVTLNGRNYRLQCGDGEEPRVQELGAYVQAKVAELAVEFGSSAQDRLLVAALLILADELFEVRAEGRSKPVASAIDTLPRNGRSPRPRRTEAADESDPLAVRLQDLKAADARSSDARSTEAKSNDYKGGDLKSEVA
jgi:cell division protein ZapA